LSSAEAAEKAVELLNDRDLDGRQVIVEIAKAADQKEKDRKDRRATRRPGRRGTKAVPGEVTEAEAAGEAPAEPKEEEATPAEGAAKPRRKKAPASPSLCSKLRLELTMARFCSAKPSPGVPQLNLLRMAPLNQKATLTRSPEIVR
jgi:hypothetical protein